ncbi:MAG: ATP-binding protein [Leptospiraceae bacterium]|nr:ATP-binding protein [Leptospiraceae bacterium]
MNLANRKQTEGFTEELAIFYASSNFRKFLFIFILGILIFELILGGIFNFFVAEKIEQERKKNFQSAWENYLTQKWKQDLSKITGYIWWEKIWEQLYYGDKQSIKKAFYDDISIREEYDFFSVYTNPEKSPEIFILGKNQSSLQISSEILKKLYKLQNRVKGTNHLFVPLDGNEIFLVSTSALCDNLGNPKFDGIAIFATKLESFLALANEIVPATLKVEFDFHKEFFQIFPISNRLKLEKEFFISVTPNYSATKLLNYIFLVSLSIQAVVSLVLFSILASRYTEIQTKHLSKLIDSSDTLNRELTNKVRELAALNQKLEQSESRYKHLIESSKDIIFSINKNGFIITVNKAMENVLGIKASDLVGKYFLDLAYNPERKIETLEKQVLMEKFEEVQETKGNVVFEMIFETKSKEPLYMDVRLEYVPYGDSFIVIGRAFTIREDPMLKFFISEKKCYFVQNYITHAEQISQRITNNLHKYLNEHEYFTIRICVREMIINAIEHGNLEIDFNLKTNLKETQTYYQYLRQQQQNPIFSKRRVKVYYSLNPKKLSYLIIDEGKGFDHKKFIEYIKNNKEHELPHGRGILMTLHSFDVVRYNEKGNAVYLAKFLNQEKCTE